jgi:enoyl-CoA hydratase/carnithine racemase
VSECPLLRPCAWRAFFLEDFPMADTVLLDVTDGVATLTLNRPQALNALSIPMMPDLAAAARELAARKDYGVVVLQGAGDHFMAGGDLKDFAGQLHLSREARLAEFKALIVQHIHPTVEILPSLPQPVIAKVRGACAGFGLSLMLGCDLAICADNAKFTTAYASIALSAFEAAGMIVTPAPTGWLADHGEPSGEHFLPGQLPNANSAYTGWFAVHEAIGRLAYRLSQ